MRRELTLARMMTVLRAVEKNGRWFFSARNASSITGIHDMTTVARDLAYYVESGMIEHVGEGVYAFRISSMVPDDAQEILMG